MIGNRREPAISGQMRIGNRWAAVRTVSLLLLLSSVAGAQTRGVAQLRNPADFWSALGDTTLKRLVTDALRGNQDIEAAGARVSNARAERTSSLLDLTPSVTAASGYSRQRLASGTIPGGANGLRLPEQDVWDAGLRMSWEVDVFGRLRSSAQARGALVSAADEDLADARVVVAAQVASSYFDLRGAENRLAVARRNAENQRGTLDVTQQRLDAGRGTGLDVERAQAQLSTTLSVIPTFEAQVEVAKQRIAVLAGKEPTSGEAELAEVSAPLALPDSVIVDPASVVARRRPDVRSAEQQVDASAAYVRAARADYLPRVAIAGGAGYTSNQLNSLGNAGTPRYTIGPVISWPAFDIGRVRANSDAARATEAEAKARYRQAVLESTEDVTRSLVRYQKSRERLHHLEDAAAASERAAELARLRFTEGASDFLPVLDAERTLLEAQDRLALGRTEAAAALVAVYRATGGGR
jgi:outer membrane protein, multidrug efflux system